MSKALAHNGQIVATVNMERTLEKSEYDALPEEEKNSEEMTYFVKDYSDTDHARLVRITSEIGNVEQLANYADGTIFGAIKDLYDRLGGIYFAVDPENDILQARDDAENISNALPELSDTATDQEKLEWLRQIMGDSDDLSSIGYTTVVNAIIDMYNRLNDLSFQLNEAGTLTITDNS